MSFNSKKIGEITKVFYRELPCKNNDKISDMSNEGTSDDDIINIDQ